MEIPLFYPLPPNPNPTYFPSPLLLSTPPISPQHLTTFSGTISTSASFSEQIPMNSAEVIVLSDDDDSDDFALVPECVTQEMMHQLKVENNPQIERQYSEIGASDLRMTSIYSLAGATETYPNNRLYVPGSVSLSELGSPLLQRQSSDSRLSSSLQQEQTSYSGISPSPQHNQVPYSRISPPLQQGQFSYSRISPPLQQEQTSYSRISPPLQQEQTSYSRISPPLQQEQTSYSRISPPLQQEQSSYSRISPPLQQEQSLVSKIQVSSVVSLADSPTIRTIDNSDSEGLKANVATPEINTSEASGSATEQTKLSLSTVMSILDELRAKSVTVFDTGSPAEFSPSSEKPASDENTNSQKTEHSQTISRSDTDVDTSSEIFVSVSSTSTVDPQESLRENFQPTQILKFSQLLSYQQLFHSDDETTKAIREMVECPICKTPLGRSLKAPSISKRQANITQHLKTKHNVVGTKCSACKKTRVPEWRVPCLCRTCDVCQKLFPAGVSFQRHLKSAHIRLQDDNPSDFFQCILSSSCSFASESIPVFAKHLAEEHFVVTHQDDDPSNTIVKCPLCSFKRHTPGSLKNHIVRFHFNGSGKKLRDKKHKSLSSSIFMFSGSFDRSPSPSSSAPVADYLCESSNVQS